MEKIVTAERSLMSPPVKRRTSLQVQFDKRWKLKYTSNDYLSLYFHIPFSVLVESKQKFKDCIMEVILKREAGEEMYNSLYIPENNIDKD